MDEYTNEDHIRVAIHEVIRVPEIGDWNRKWLVELFNNYRIVKNSDIQDVKDIMERW